MYFLVTIVFEFPSFEMWTESQSAQTIQLTVSFFKKSLTFWCKYIRKFLYYVDIMFCLLFCSYILTVHTLMFVVKPYLSICMICSYSFGFWVSIRSFLKAWCIFRSFSCFFFSLISCQWYSESMILLYDTNNDVEENGGNVSQSTRVCGNEEFFNWFIEFFCRCSSPRVCLK